MDFEDLKMMRVSDLAFDLDNPRLVEFDLKRNASDSEVVQILWDTMDVRELVLSIVASGFFQHEPLIVVREDGKNVVIEGNRRLAAVKILLDPAPGEILNANVPAITEEKRDLLRELPTIGATRKNAWRYLGFKHVNGPAKWSSYAKSEYIAKVRSDFGVSLEDIARQIGDTHRIVQRLFRGIMVLKQAEHMEVFDREDRWRRHFSFSHLYTGLGYPGISSFIGLRPESEEDLEPVPRGKKVELRELFIWLYGSKGEDKPPVIQSQNPDLRRLDAVVANRSAIAAFRAGSELSYAFEISRPSPNVFEESLHAAKRNLEKARSLLTTGYDDSRQLLRVAEEVADLADDLYSEMLRKRNPGKRRRAAKTN